MRADPTVAWRFVITARIAWFCASDLRRISTSCLAVLSEPTRKPAFVNVGNTLSVFESTQSSCALKRASAVRIIIIRVTEILVRQTFWPGGLKFLENLVRRTIIFRKGWSARGITVRAQIL